MDLYLSVPVTKPIGAPLVREVLSFGFDGVRVDLSESHDDAEAQLREFSEIPECKTILLLAHGTMRRESGEAWGRGTLLAHIQDTCIKARSLGLFDIENQPAWEIGNEPDLAHKMWKDNPVALAGLFSEAYHLIRGYSKNAVVMTPSISNLNERGIRYLEKMFRRSGGVPDGAHAAIHRYPHKGDPDRPHDGWGTRPDEVHRMRSTIGRARPFHVTETGFANYEYQGRFVSHEVQADIFEEEYDFWLREGAASMCWYQINDGPFTDDVSNDVKRLRSYGIRTFDGQWKPVAARVAQVTGRAT